MGRLPRLRPSARSALEPEEARVHRDDDRASCKPDETRNVRRSASFGGLLLVLAALPVPAAHPEATRWGLSIHKAGTNLAVEESMGIRSFLTGGLPGSGAGGNAPPDLERILLPGLQDGYADVWERRIFEADDLAAEHGADERPACAGNPAGPDGRQSTNGYRGTAGRPDIVLRGRLGGEPGRARLELEYDLTSQAYAAAYQNYSNNGYRLIDIEAYPTPSGLRYAAIWWASCDNTNWKEVARQLTAEPRGRRRLCVGYGVQQPRSVFAAERTRPRCTTRTARRRATRDRIFRGHAQSARARAQPRPAGRRGSRTRPSLPELPKPGLLPSPRGLRRARARSRRMDSSRDPPLLDRSPEGPAWRSAR